MDYDLKPHTRSSAYQVCREFITLKLECVYRTRQYDVLLCITFALELYRIRQFPSSYSFVDRLHRDFVSVQSCQAIADRLVLLDIYPVTAGPSHQMATKRV